MGIQKQKNGSWRVQFRRKGLPVLDKCFATEEEAQAAYQRVVDAGKHKETASDTLKELWGKYEQSQLFLAKAPRTQETERGRIKPVMEVLGDYSLKHLEEDVGAIYDYIDTRCKHISKKTGKPLSATNVRLEVAALSSLVNYAKQRRLVRENFVRLISRPVAKPRKRRVPKIEQGKLEMAAHDWNSPAALPARFACLLRELGCRPGELRGLLITNINLLETQVLFVDTKNGEDRMVHATPAAVKFLSSQLAYAKEHHPESPFLFSTLSRKKQWKEYNYTEGVKLLREYGIVGKDYHSHANRREFVSRAIESGMAYPTIKKQTGHKSVQSIEIYDQGLSTAPGIRALIDELSSKVKDEKLLGMLEAIGASPEEALNALKNLGKEKKTEQIEDGWVSWPEAK